MITYYTDCTGPRCNSTYDLCRVSYQTSTTPGMEEQMNVSLSSSPSTCPNKTDTTTEHIMTTATANCPQISPYITRSNLYSRHIKTATSTVYTTVVVSQLYASPTVQNNMVKTPITAALGGVVGLLVMLLSVVTLGWMMTCWTVRKIKHPGGKPEQNR